MAINNLKLYDKNIKKALYNRYQRDTKKRALEEMKKLRKTKKFNSAREYLILVNSVSRKTAHHSRAKIINKKG